jgi:hypothetical protein
VSLSNPIWKAEIVAESVDMTVESLLESMQKGWNEFHTYLQTLTPEQMTRSKDHAGWTVKDHIMHLVVWEDSINALLRKQSRAEEMGLDREIWQSGDYDHMNALIQQQHQHMSLDDVLRAFHMVHEDLVDLIQTLSDEDLKRPYRWYQPDTPVDRPVIDWIIQNTYEHYAEHIPWMAAIARNLL